MTVRRLGPLAAVLALVVSTGCARTGDPGGPPAGAPAPPSFSPSAAAAPSEAGAQTLSGTVTAGVEPDCLLLTAQGGTHLLVFDDPALRAQAEAGTRITVTGRAEPAMMTTCQQGTPFIVTAVRAG